MVRSPDTKLGPAPRPTTPMKTARPTVSNTQSAGSGMRPKVGRTERSQPKTSPMMSAPPLAVRLRGRSPTVRRERAQEAAHQDAEAHEHDVGLAGGPLHVAEGLPGALDVGLGARRAGAGRRGSGRVRARRGSPRRPRTSFISTTPRPCSAATSARVRSAISCFVTDHVQRGHGEVEQRPVLDLLAEGRVRGEEHVPARRDGRDVARSEDGPAARPRGSPSPRRIRSTKTRSGAKERSTSATERPTAARPGCGRPARPTRGRRAGPVLGLRRPPLASASSFRLSARRSTPQQPRRQAGEEPDHEARAHEVADRVGHRNVVQQARPSPPPAGRGARSCCRRCR